nr:YadA-like family protein [Dyella acidiphila]
MADGRLGVYDTSNTCVANTRGQGGVDQRAVAPRAALADDLIKVTYNTSSGTQTNASATGSGTIAIGDGAVSGGTNAVDSIAVGIGSKSTASQAVAVGRYASATGVYAIALSNEASAAATSSLAFGDKSSVDATSTGAAAIGSSAKVAANAANSVALGNGSTVSAANTVSIGSSTLTRTLTGLANGEVSSASKDAINGAQLYALQGRIDNGTVGLVQQDATTKKITVASGSEGDTVDFSGTKDGKALTRKLTGLSAGSLSENSTDAVTGAQLYATNANVKTNSDDIAALQTGSLGLVQQDADTHAITVAAGTGGSAISIAGTDGGRVLGGLANGTENTDAVTIAQLKAVGLMDGNGNTLAALTYDDLTMSSAMLGGTKGTVIRNLANGSIAHGSSEAVNGGQLFDLQQNFTNQINTLNGQVNNLNDNVNGILQGIADGSITGNGSVTSPGTGTNSASVGEGSTASGSGSTAVGVDATASGDNSTASGSHAVASGTDSTATGANAVASGSGSTASGANAVASGTNSTAVGSNSSATGNNSVALGANSTADRDNTVSVGSAGNERQITNVAAGTERTDAANWGQVQDAVNGVQDWARGQFEQVDRRINGMGAMSAAYSQMAFSAQGVDKLNRVGVGVGTQGGQSAFAVGYSHQIAPNLNVSFGGSTSGRDTSVGAGMAIGW